MPSGGVETGWQSCLRSRSVYGPYDYKVVMHQGNSRVNGPHQGGWVTSPDGRHWFIHFQDVVELGRIIHLQPMCFLDDWPFIGQDQNGDGIGEPVEEWPVPAEGMPEYAIRQSDDLRRRHWGSSGSGRPIPIQTFIPWRNIRDTCGCIVTGIRAGKTCSGMRPMC